MPAVEKKAPGGPRGELPVGKDGHFETLGEMLVRIDGGKGGLRDPKDGSWHGPGYYPPHTMEYFTFHFKNKDHAHSQYEPTPILLEHIETSYPGMTVLNCEGRNLQDEWMLPLVHAFRKNTTVTELLLSRNCANHAYLDLMETLKENTTVTKLDLKNNDMHDVAIQAVCEMLSCNSTIKYLDLTCNFVRENAKHLAEALTMNSTLETLILDNCQIEDDGAKALFDVFPKTNIKQFRAFNNICLEKEWRKKMRGFGFK